MAKDDDRKFNARLFWARVNNEDLNTVILDTKIQTERKSILALINGKERNTQEIYEATGVNYRTISKHIMYLKRRGFKIRSRKSAYGAVHFYTPTIGLGLNDTRF